MPEIRVLSVDWDFFFPNQEDFDWGHDESRVFIETIWPVRWANRDILTSKLAKDVFHTDQEVLGKFWDSVLDKEPISLCIAESHASLRAFLLRIGGKFKPTWIIDNYDAHHDTGYGPPQLGVTCGNWAAKIKNIGSYTVHYPLWRKDRPESAPIGNGVADKVSVEYGLPFEPSYYDVVFICRSGAWTPPWCDEDWLKFIGRFKGTQAWAEKSLNKYALSARPFDLANAKIMEAANNEYSTTQKVRG